LILSHIVFHLQKFLHILVMVLVWMPACAQNSEAPLWQNRWIIAAVIVLLGVAIALLITAGRRIRKRKQIDRIIEYFSNSVYGDNSASEICWDIARNCISQLHFEDCVVYLLDREKNVLVQKAAYGPKNPKGHEIKDPIEIKVGKGIVGTVAATGRAELVGDTSRDARYIVDDERRYSEISVPILHENRVIGVIDSEHQRRNFFTQDHLRAMTTIASISASKIAEAQAEESARRNEIRYLEIDKLLAESQLMALRAQMNPHFVFNCLNSIQECIVTKKYGEASDYLNKFAKLFRMVLNNSGKQLVTMEEEIETLRLYLDLEHMRFGKSFNYQIEMDENLEVEEILVPAMLLQPFVENALWHGLMHKDGERNLKLGFRKLSDEVFESVIDDNGIGRKKAQELKARQPKNKHESKGLSITNDRINLLRKQNQHANLEIVDKIDKQGAPAGTMVIIQLSTYLGN
jgi:putative methionine-R-sulfoxide reductase with GAF domain